MAKRRKKQLAGFIKKDPMKDIGKVAGRAGLRIGGALGATWIGHKLTTPDATTGKPMMEPKYASLVIMAAGLAGEVFIEDEYARSVAEGMTVVGGLKAFATFMPDQATKIGLSGVGSAATDTKPLPGDIMADVDRILAEAQAQADAPTDPTRGNQQPGGVQGVDEEPAQLNPAAFAG